MLPRRVSRVGVHDHAKRVDCGRLQVAHRERVAGHLLSRELHPQVAVGRILTRERMYDAHLDRPRAERERHAGRVHRHHGVLVRFLGHCGKYNGNDVKFSSSDACAPDGRGLTIDGFGH